MFRGVFQVLDSLYSHRIPTMIFTNGWFINKKVAARLSRYKPFLRIVVSIYGPSAKLHDAIRGRKGSWARAVSAARYVRAEGIPLHVHHCITKENLSALPEMIDLAFKLGTEKIVLSDTILIGRAAFVSSRVDVSQSKRKIYDMARRKVREHKGRMEIELSLAAPLGLRYYSMNPNMAILLTPTGDAKLDFIIPVVFGNIRHESLEQIWNRMKHAWRENQDVQKFVQSIHTNSDLLHTPFGIPNITDYVRADG
jgi:MoaA/NifB/PqqE/SkfB family radical SAM enzyme